MKERAVVGFQVTRRLRRAIQRVVVASLVALSVLTLVPATASATPERGSTGWTLLLCKYADQDAEPHTRDQMNDFLFTEGTGGVADYWRDQSAGAINVDGSDVRGWYDTTMTMTTSRAEGTTRWSRIQACVSAARAADGESAFAPSNRLIVYLNECLDAGASGGIVLIDPCSASSVAFVAHEMAHAMDLKHSYSNDTTYQNAPWSQPGEYDDPWDLLSANNVYTFPGSYSGSGPNLSAHSRDILGWLDATRVRTFGTAGETDEIVTLAPLGDETVAGAHLLRVPTDPNDLTKYMTVEFRTKTGWDAGIPSDVVLLHKVRDSGEIELIRDLSRSDRSPASVVDLPDVGVRIEVVGVDGPRKQATVRVTSDMAESCIAGFVWREATADDRVCVTPAVRQATQADNEQAASRVAAGTDRCVEGYVWREAVPGDKVCVHPRVRTEAQQDNDRSSERTNPSLDLFGPNSCRDGFVWRGVDARDYVCVTPATLTQVTQDNAAARSRVNPDGPYGPETCIDGFVWREAVEGDKVCVTVAVRDQAHADNEATGRYKFS